MARYIDADKLKIKVSYGQMRDDDVLLIPLRDVYKSIDNAPTADVKENIHGRWNTDKESTEYATCSVCGHCDWDCTESEYFKFCPNCGAVMDEGKNGWFDSFDWLTIREEAIE